MHIFVEKGSFFRLEKVDPFEQEANVITKSPGEDILDEYLPIKLCKSPAIVCVYSHIMYM